MHFISTWMTFDSLLSQAPKEKGVNTFVEYFWKPPEREQWAVGHEGPEQPSDSAGSVAAAAAVADGDALTHTSQLHSKQNKSHTSVCFCETQCPLKITNSALLSGAEAWPADLLAVVSTHVFFNFLLHADVCPSVCTTTTATSPEKRVQPICWGTRSPSLALQTRTQQQTGISVTGAGSRMMTSCGGVSTCPLQGWFLQSNHLYFGINCFVMCHKRNEKKNQTKGQKKS